LFDLVLYIVDKGTFKTAEEILTKLFENSELRMRTRPVILVGNKCDLVRKRQVSTNGKSLSRFFIKLYEKCLAENSEKVSQNKT